MKPNRIIRIAAFIGLLLCLAQGGSTAQTAGPQFLAAAIQSAGNPNVRVWVNTNSGVYHCPGTRWYGNTKSGQYMTQRQAQAKGYRPAYGSVCG